MLASMTGHTVQEYSFKRKDQAVTLGSKTSVKIHDDNVQIDPQFLFQRLVVAVQKQEDPSLLFQYELCSFPPALFDFSDLLREAKKQCWQMPCGHVYNINKTPLILLM